VIALLLAGCVDDVTFIEGHFDGPAAVAVLHPETGGPFYEPVGFVANSRSGRIVPLDIKHGWLLADDRSAPFLEAQPIPTGADRILGEIAVFAPTTDEVSLFVADAANATLLSVDYIQGVAEDGSFITARPRLEGEVEFIDADGSGDAATLESFTLGTGYATTEEWVLEFDGTSWSVTGSRSGAQEYDARSLEPYLSDDGSLEFLIQGAATKGDRFEFVVDSGIEELDLGGVVEGLHMAPTQEWLYAAVTSLEDGTGRVAVLDPLTRTERGSLDLPEGARPHRFSSDLSGDLLYISDARSGAVYEVLVDAADPTASLIRVLEMPGPVVDVAYQADEDYEHLFVALAGDTVLHLWDLQADGWKDINTATPEVDGIELQTPVTGLATGLDPVLLVQEGPNGTRPRERVIAAATFEGVLTTVEARTGCLMVDEEGPNAVLDPDVPFDDEGDISTPTLEASGATGRSVQVNPCGGISRTQTWVLTYDGSLGAWVVEGGLAGVQENLVFEDERYVSDKGEISLLVRSGTLPSTNGDRFTFHVDSGVAEVNGDISGDGFVAGDEPRLEIPTRPVPFSYLAGPEAEAWAEVNRKVGVLWAQQNADTVLRVNLEANKIEVIWD